MAIKRPFLRLAILCSWGIAMVGCGNRSEQSQPEASATQIVAGARPTQEVDHLEFARRMLRIRNFDAATDAAYKALLQDPQNGDAKLVAGEAEAGRGNHQIAVDLVGTIDIESRLGQRAAELHYQQLARLNRYSAAADVILAAQQVIADVPEWNHHAWELLNRVGRREEASLQAEALCRAGQATEAQLHSLVRRTSSFPFNLAEEDDPKKHFGPGLGMARWYFTRNDYSSALAELASQNEKGFDLAAACALYGRLLAETQAFEEFPSWHAKCNDQVRVLGDYWAALGIYFYDQRQFEASARALMEAVYRNPTDRLSLQRLSKAFYSLQRSQDGHAYRERGINIADTERLSDAILEADDDDDSLRMSLVKELAALGRPFETLQWSLSLAAKSSMERAKIEQQRQELQSTDRVLSMASESSLMGIAREEFGLDGAMELLQSPQGVKSDAVGSSEVLARPRLVNVAVDVGFVFQWYRDLEFDPAIIPIHESVGGGIAVLDYDLDGWPDVYLAQGSGDPPTDQCTRSNVLLRNQDGKFAELTADARVEDYNYSSGLASGDVNQDGFPDLMLGSLGHNRLLINNGDGTFRDVTDRLGPIEDRFTSSLAIADINGDALPDLFETNYIEMEGGFVVPELDEEGKPEMPGPLSHYAGPDRWLENLGDGSFQIHEITREIAIPGTSLGIVVTDFDADGSNDVFVGNDIRPNHLLVHFDDGLSNVADGKGVANGYRGIPNGCMGISAADYNRDGLIDLHITNFNNESANLYVQTAGGLFSDIAIRYGIDKISDPMVGFGTKSIDIDRNGWLDLIVTNGHIFDTRIFGEKYFKMPPQMMMSKGRRFELTEVDDESGYWKDIYLGRTMASLDFDRNGSLDVIIGHLEEPAALLHNQTVSDGDWIQLELVGTTAERDAIGTRVVVTTGGQRFTHWVTAGDGYFCSDEPVLDFGLGIGNDVARVDVFWPGGERQAFENLQSGHRYLMIQGEQEALRRW